MRCGDKKTLFTAYRTKGRAPYTLAFSAQIRNGGFGPLADVFGVSLVQHRHDLRHKLAIARGGIHVVAGAGEDE